MARTRIASSIYSKLEYERQQREETAGRLDDKVRRRYNSAEYVAVAMARYNDIHTFAATAQSSHILLGKGSLREDDYKNKKKRKEYEAAKIDNYLFTGKDVFEELDNSSIVGGKYITSIKDVGDNGVKEINYQRTKSSFIKQGTREMLENYENAAINGFIYYDTETLSGPNQFGQQQTNALTEFSFIRHDGVTKVNGGLKASKDTLYSSVVGTSKEQYEYHLKLINRYLNHDRTLTQGQLVEIDRLARTGHEKTILGKYGKDGIINFEDFAPGEDVKYKSRDMLLRGAKMYYDIGVEQSKHLVDWSYNGKTYRMKGVEAHLLDGLRGAFENNMTLVGHNLKGFDNPVLDIIASSDNVTAGFSNAYYAMTGGIGMAKAKTLDTLAVVRTSNATKDPNFYDGDMMKEIVEKGLSANQQEALAQHYKIDYEKEGNGAAHLATTDTKVGAKIFMHPQFWKEMNIKGIQDEKGSNKERLKKGQIFMASQGNSVRNSNLWGFVKDDFSKAYRTTDGFSIGMTQGKVEYELFDQTLFKKNALYEITGINKLKETEEMRKFLGGIAPDLRKQGLFSMTFRLYTNNDEVKKAGHAYAERTVVGTADMLSQFMSGNFYHLADRQADGSILDVADKETKDALSVIKKEKGKTTSITNYSFGQAEGISDNAILNDAAARNFRQHKLRQDTGLLSMVADMRETKRTLGTSNDTFIDLVRDRSLRLAEKMENDPTAVITDQELEMTVQGYAGFLKQDLMSGKYDKKVFTETYSSFMSRIGQVNNQFDIHLSSLNLALKQSGAINASNLPFTEESLRGGKNVVFDAINSNLTKTTEAYYMNNMNTFQDYVIHKTKGNTSPNTHDYGTYKYNLNRFRVSLDGFRNSASDAHIDLNLEDSGVGLVKKLFNATGRSYDKSSEADKKAMLKSFGGFLVDKGIITDDAAQKAIDNIAMATDTVESAAKKIYDPLRKLKASPDGYKHGLLEDDSTEISDIRLVHNQKNFGLKDKEIKEVLTGIEKNPTKFHYTAEEDTLKGFVNDYVNNVLFGGQTEQEVSNSLREYGYSSKDIKRMMDARAIRRRDTVEYVHNLFSAIQNAGAHVGYNEETKTTFVRYGEKTEVLQNMPMDVYENGRFYTQMGNTKTANMIGVYKTGYGDREELVFASRLKKAAMSRQSMRYQLFKAREEGNLFEVLHWINQSVSAELRQTTSADKPDIQDLSTQFMMDFKDLFLNLHKVDLSGIEAGLTGTPEDIERSRKILKKLKNGPLDRLNTEELFFVTRHSKEIFDQIRSFNGPGLEQMDLDPSQIQVENRHLGDFLYNYGNVDSPGDSAGFEKRYVKHQFARAYALDISSKTVKDLGIDEDIQFGRVIESTSRYHLDNNRWKTTVGTDGDKEFTKVVRMKGLTMNTEDFHRLISTSKILQKEENKFALQKLLSGHLDEGSAMFDPKVADEIFNKRGSEQYIAYNRVANFNADHELTDIEKKIKANFIIHIPNDNKKGAKNRVNIEFSRGFFVDVGKAAISKAGMDNSTEEVKAKQKGFLSLQLIEKESGLVEDRKERVNALLQNLLQKELDSARKQKRNHKLKEEDIERARQKAFEMLNKKYDIKYHIETADAAENIKIAEEFEKGMYRAMYGGLGTMNSKIQGILEGMDARGKSHGAKGFSKYLSGSVLDHRVLKDFKDKFLTGKGESFIALGKSKFGQILLDAGKDQVKAIEKTVKKQKALQARFRSGQMTEDQLKEIVKQEAQDTLMKNFLAETRKTYLGKNAKQSNENDRKAMKRFYEDMLEERYKPWELLKKSLIEAGMDPNDVKNLHAVSQHLPGTKKHADVFTSPDKVASALWDKFSDEYKNDPANSNINLKKNAADKILHDRYVAQRVLDEFNKVGAMTGLSISQTGDSIIADDNYSISNKKLQEVVKQNKLDTAYKKITLSNGQEAYYNIDKRTFLQLPNYDNARTYEEGNGLNRGVKFNHRNITILEANRMYGDRRDIAISAYENVFGKGSAVANTVSNILNDIEDGSVLASGAVDFIKRKALIRPTDHGKEEILNLKLKGKKLDKAYNKMAAKMNADGIGKDLDEAKNILKTTVKHVQQQFEGAGGFNKIGLGVIEDVYSAISFGHARKFHQKASFREEDIQEYAAKNNLDIVNIEDLLAIRDGRLVAGQKNVLDGREFILDMKVHGSDLKTYDMVSGQGRYIYMPWQRAKNMGDDGYARSEFQKKAIVLQRQVQELIAGTTSMNNDDKRLMEESEISSLQARIVSGVHDLQQQISYEGTNKDSAYARLTRAEVQDSGFYTAYGNTLKGIEGNPGGIANLHFNTKGITGKNVSIDYIQAERKMEQALNGTGKISENLAFDYTILSDDAMKKYYESDNFFSRLGLGKDKKIQEALSNAIRTDFENGGTTLSLMSRDPQGYFKSTSVNALGFSNVVKGDTAIVGATGMESKKGDFDSDKISSALLKAEAVLTLNGHKRTVEVDLAAFNGLKALQESGKFKGLKIDWTKKGLKEMKSHMEAHIANASSNTLWQAKRNIVANIANKYDMSNLGEFALEGTSGGKILGNATFEPRLYTDEIEAARLKTNYENVLKLTAQHEGIDTSVEDWKDKFIGTGDKALKEQEIRGKIYQAFDSTGGKMAGLSRAEAYDALRYNLSEYAKGVDALGFTAKHGAGEVNYNIFAYLRLAQETDHVTATQMGDIMHTHIALGEMTLSPKHGGNDAYIPKLGEALNKAFSAMNTGQGRHEAYIQLRDIVKDVLTERQDKELLKTSGFLQKDSDYRNLSGKEREEFISKRINEVAENYARMVKDVDISGQGTKFHDLAMTKGLNYNQALKYMKDNKESLQQWIQTTDEISSDLGKGHIANAINSPRQVNAAISDLKDFEDTAMDAMLRNMAKQASNVKVAGMGKGMAAAVSIAGGLFVSGLANNPAAKSAPPPADTQAMGAVQEQQEQYGYSQVPQFSDTNLDSMRGGPSGGYVINISGNTSQTRDQALGAITSAIGAGVPQSSSMNIQMNTSYKDQISQFQLQRMMAAAI